MPGRTRDTLTAMFIEGSFISPKGIPDIRYPQEETIRPVQRFVAVPAPEPVAFRTPRDPEF